MTDSFDELERRMTRTETTSIELLDASRDQRLAHGASVHLTASRTRPIEQDVALETEVGRRAFAFVVVENAQTFIGRVGHILAQGWRAVNEADRQRLLRRAAS